MLRLLTALAACLFYVQVSQAQSDTRRISVPRQQNHSADFSLLHQEIWKSQFKQALRADPRLAFRMAYAAKDPLNAEALESIDNYNLTMKYATKFPGVGELSELVVELNKDFPSGGAPADKAQAEMTAHMNKHPELYDVLATNAYNMLASVKVSPATATDQARAFAKAIAGDIRSGGFLDVDADEMELLTQANPNMVMKIVGEGLAILSREDRAVLRRDAAALKAFVEKQFIKNQGLIASLAQDVKDIQKQSGEIQKALANAAKRREALEAVEKARVERQVRIQETEAGIYLASTLVGLVDPKLGKELEVFGHAVLKASLAIDALSAGFSFAATGNLVSAAMALGTLFSGQKPDPAVVRHQEIMDALRTIHEQIAAVRADLRTVNLKLDDVVRTLAAAKFDAAVSLATVLNDLSSLRGEMSSIRDYITLTSTNDMEAAFMVLARNCQQQFANRRAFVKDNSTELGMLFIECESGFRTYAVEVSRLESWTKASFTIGDDSATAVVHDSLRRAVGLQAVMGVLPQLRSALRSVAPSLLNEEEPDLPPFNPMLWELSVRKWVETVLAVPEWNTRIAHFDEMVESGEFLARQLQPLRTEAALIAAAKLHKRNGADLLKLLKSDYDGYFNSSFNGGGQLEKRAASSRTAEQRALITPAEWAYLGLVGGLVTITRTVEVAGVVVESVEECEEEMTESGRKRMCFPVNRTTIDGCAQVKDTVTLKDNPDSLVVVHKGELCSYDFDFVAYGADPAIELHLKSMREAASAGMDQAVAEKYSASRVYGFTMHPMEFPAGNGGFSQMKDILVHKVFPEWSESAAKVSLLRLTARDNELRRLNESAALLLAVLDVRFGECRFLSESHRALTLLLADGKVVRDYISQRVPYLEFSNMLAFADKRLKVPLAAGEADDVSLITDMERELSQNPGKFTSCNPGISSLEQGFSWLSGFAAAR
jgi:hypothetical protein